MITNKLCSVRSHFLEGITSYYNARLAENGETPKGVDWNGLESQTNRFNQLCKIICPRKTNFSVNDLGCGYAALLDYLKSKKPSFQYVGIDISANMIAAAQKRHPHATNTRFKLAAKPDQISHYSVASGIFNVRLNKSDDDWESYIIEILDSLNQASSDGFSFNCLTSFSEMHKRKKYLHYANPFDLVKLCIKRYSRNVALLHDYGLFEFTILVRKKL